MIDLIEHPKLWDKTFNDLLNKWCEEMDNEATYEKCEEALKDFEANGYTFEYGLDAVPYNFRKL